MKHMAIIVAAGSGTRFGSDIPKQFADVCGKPLIYHALEAFQKSDIDEVLVVAPKEYIDHCYKIKGKYNLSKIIGVVEGGDARPFSVYNGLLETSSNRYVHIHDGARPLVPVKLINDMMEAVEKKKSLVCAIPEKDTIKQVEGETVRKTLDRRGIYRVQTPQSFEYAILRSAYDRMMEEEDYSATDDASVVELFSGEHVHIFYGSEKNIKVTTRQDLEIVEALLRNHREDEN